MPYFSVVIPTFNREDLIAETLESIARQSYRDFETIVVDDGSTDRTCEIVESFSFVRLVRQKNSGPGSARNHAIEFAKGKYIAFIDSDDVWFPWTLSIYAATIEKSGSPTFVAGRPTIFRDASELVNIKESDLEYRNFADYFASGDQWRWYGVSSFVIDKMAFQSVGGFRFGCVNGEDAELTMRIGCMPGFVQVSCPSTFGYRTHVGNITANSEKTLEGITDLIVGEKTGRFPGGSQRRSDRRRIITRLARPWALAALRERRWDAGWKIYRETFTWQLAEGRVRFLFAIPFVAIYLLFFRGQRIKR